MTAPRAATVEHTHLFAGARLNLGPGAVTPGQLSVRMSDGVVVDAELVEVDGPGVWVLAVPGFTTAAGAGIAPKVWSVRNLSRDAEDRILVVGPRIELQRNPEAG